MCHFFPHKNWLLVNFQTNGYLKARPAISQPNRFLQIRLLTPHLVFGLIGISNSSGRKPSWLQFVLFTLESMFIRLCTNMQNFCSTTVCDTNTGTTWDAGNGTRWFSCKASILSTVSYPLQTFRNIFLTTPYFTKIFLIQHYMFKLISQLV